MTTSGKLNINDDDLEKADVIGMEEHGNLGSNMECLISISKILQNYKGKIRVWVHPGKYIYSNGSSKKHLQYLKILKLAETTKQEGYDEMMTVCLEYKDETDKLIIKLKDEYKYLERAQEEKVNCN